MIKNGIRIMPYANVNGDIGYFVSESLNENN